MLSPYYIITTINYYPDIEWDWVDGVVMAVEGLDTEVSPDVPKWNSFIARSRYKEAGVGLKLNWIDRVNVTSIGEATSPSI